MLFQFSMLPMLRNTIKLETLRSRMRFRFKEREREKGKSKPLFASITLHVSLNPIQFAHSTLTAMLSKGATKPPLEWQTHQLELARTSNELSGAIVV